MAEKEKIARLKYYINKEVDDEYIIEYAREYLDMYFPDEEIYSGDAYSRHEAVTEVKVIANTYRQYSGEDPVVLWESTNVVSSIRVLFDEPCWGLYSSQVGGSDTITIEESGVNYAVISGTGTLKLKAITASSLPIPTICSNISPVPEAVTVRTLLNI